MTDEITIMKTVGDFDLILVHGFQNEISTQYGKDWLVAISDEGMYKWEGDIFKSFDKGRNMILGVDEP